ncbi:hypothetical protein CHS0354_012421 [Potamilus streckersoni]|uniref:Uncharacterized protein n=1 Tax=Potamilus streckersoni TaxID=2493646 RepID=A0AAE0SF00_9BIVA|nr:hypothetical protein CHS0354_012421 [Potamilus streckersoni]
MPRNLVPDSNKTYRTATTKPFSTETLVPTMLSGKVRKRINAENGWKSLPERNNSLSSRLRDSALSMVIKQAKLTSWNNYCSTLNHYTPTREVCVKIKAINLKASILTPRLAGTQRNREHAEMAAHFSQASSDQNNHPDFTTQTQQVETAYPHPDTKHNEQDAPLNDHFTVYEWTQALRHKI